MSINELSNEEVIFLYLSNRKWMDTYEDMFQHKSIVDTMEILDFGKISVTKYIDDESIEEMHKSLHYKYSFDINEKLEPVASMIEDIDSDLYNKVKACFEKTEI
jgi:hypothetical protein